MDREILLQALTGSHNYNLNTETSDKDYKIFTAPTFEDLYKGEFYKENIITNTVDKDIKDIRQLPSLLWKSNIAYLELLYSVSIICSHDTIRELLELRDEIARMNLPQLFKSTGGMFNQRMRRLDKSTDGTQHLVDIYGYNTKEAMHSFRTLKVLFDFWQGGFNNLGEALRYDDVVRNQMLEIKNGCFSKLEFEGFINAYHNNFFAPLKEEYSKQKPNEELKDYIDELVMKAVRDNI